MLPLEINISSHWHGSEKSLLENTDYKNLKLIYDHLKEKGYCHVVVMGGDYDGSIARFNLEDTEMEYTHKRMYTSEECYRLKYYFNGRLSWKGKRNKPAFIIKRGICKVLLGYEGEEVLKRIDFKKEAEELLSRDIFDIDGEKLSVGDKVLYMNLRYGCGGELCHGTIHSFKAHVRDKYVSVIITNDSADEESECNYPSNQIYKK